MIQQFKKEIMPRIIPLSEGAFTVDQTKKFIPFNPEQDTLEKRERGSILVEIQPFAVITSKDILVLDTGLGLSGENGQMQIHRNLAANGINSSDVTKVLLSHLHKDHTGGIALPGKKALSFQNATYYVNRNEWDYALEKGMPSYHLDDFLLLEKQAKVVFTEGDGVLDGYIRYKVTGAHCPFHQVFSIVEDGETTFFGGDVAPQLFQMKSRFKAKYDYDGTAAMELRQQWWKQGAQEKWTFLFYHDIKYPIYQL